jgi:integrase
VRDEETRCAMLDYLAAAKRLFALETDAPVWTPDDQAGVPDERLTSHAFVHSLKRYAAEAEIDHLHLHQTRHTSACIVAEETGSFIQTQDALEHQNLSTMTVYVQHIAVKRDVHSAAVARRRRKKNTS